MKLVKLIDVMLLLLKKIKNLFKKIDIYFYKNKDEILGFLLSLFLLSLLLILPLSLLIVCLIKSL